MSDEKTILYETADGIATITLNRPQAYNAFDRRMHAELVRVLKEAERDSAVRCIVITGALRGESPWYIVTEMYYDDAASMRAGLASPEAAEAGKQLMTFAKGLVTFYTADVLHESWTPA